jgi:hypothetical protein
MMEQSQPVPFNVSRLTIGRRRRETGARTTQPGERQRRLNHGGHRRATVGGRVATGQQGRFWECAATFQASRSEFHPRGKDD